MKSRINTYLESDSLPKPEVFPRHATSQLNNAHRDPATNMKSLVNQNLSDFNIKGALQILSGDSSFVNPSKESLDTLQQKHPRPHLTLRYPLPQALPLHQHTSVKTKYRLQSLPSPMAPRAGPEGLRPQHLKDCISISAGDASTSLVTSLTELVNHLTNGHLPTALRPFLYGAQLHRLRKNNGDLRPIAVGCTYRHLVAKVCLRPYISRLCKLLQPSQLGVGTPL